MTFSRREILELLVAWAVLGFAFSIGELSYGIESFLVFFGIALVGLLAGFGAHELAHKYAAQHFGYHAEFRLWRMGIIIALASALLTMGGLIFAAPGAVYIMAAAGNREHGIISISGPLANLAMAALFYLLSSTSGLLGFLGWWGFTINLWLAAFNLLPIPPLDGRAILSWNWKLWVLMALAAWGTFALVLLGRINPL